jgi:hypothetical protein
MDCPTSLPYCEISTSSPEYGTCVQCTMMSQCTEFQPICVAADHCGCNTNTDCPTGLCYASKICASP